MALTVPQLQQRRLARTTHGAQSEAQIVPVARAQKRRLLRQIGLTAGDLDGVGRALLDNWARAQAKVELLDRYFAVHGFLDEAGDPQPATKLYFVAGNSARLAIVRLREHLRGSAGRRRRRSTSTSPAPTGATVPSVALGTAIEDSHLLGGDFRPHPKQRDLLDVIETARMTVACCGRRFGKTKAAAAAPLWNLLLVPELDGLVAPGGGFMASSWIERRRSSAGTRYRVRYRLGGRESKPRYGGSFKTMREAKLRLAWIAGEFAVGRAPNLGTLVGPEPSPTLREIADRWRVSRVDVRESTAIQHRTALGRVLPVLGDRPVDQIAPADVAMLVAKLDGQGKARESIRKSVTALAMVHPLDVQNVPFAGTF